MKLSAVAVGTSLLIASAMAHAQTVVVGPGQNPPPQPPPPPAQQAPPVVIQQAPPAQQTNVVPAPAEAQAPNQLIVEGQQPPPGGELKPETRPNRKLLMTGLIMLGAPYVASIGVAAGSGHKGDSYLWMPVLGPWFDIGARGSCPAGADCGTEAGDDVLLVGDGVLQTVGALEIVGAFVFPETIAVPAVSLGGTKVHVAPSKVGGRGYGLTAVGEF